MPCVVAAFSFPCSRRLWLFGTTTNQHFWNTSHITCLIRVYIGDQKRVTKSAAFDFSFLDIISTHDQETFWLIFLVAKCLPRKSALFLILLAAVWQGSNQKMLAVFPRKKEILGAVIKHTINMAAANERASNDIQHRRAAYCYYERVSASVAGQIERNTWTRGKLAAGIAGVDWNSAYKAKKKQIPVETCFFSGRAELS